LKLEGGLFKKGIFIVILKATGILASYAFTLYVTNFFGAKAYGQYSLFFAIINFSAILALFGTERSVIKLYNQDQLAEGRQNVIHSLFAVSITSIIMSGLLYAGWDFLVATLFSNSPEISKLRPYVLILLFYSLYIFISEAIRAKSKMKLYGILRFNALFLSALVLLIFLRQSETDWAPIKSFVFAALAIGIIGLILFYREYGLRLPLQKSRFQKIIDISYPMLLASSMGLIIGWVDTFMLGYFVDEKAVGIYNVAYKVAFVSSILLTTVTTVISPRVARLSSMNQYEELKVMVKNIAKMLSLGAALIFLVTIFNMELILSFFGKEFIAGASALGVLLIGQFISSYSGPVAMLLQMTGHEKNFMYISIVAMLMNVVLNLTLIPSYGFMGAAIASAATLIANNLMCVYFVKKKLGFYSFYIPFK